MDESRPDKVRSIIFENPETDKFLWTCSHCEWNTPYLAAEGSHAIDPIQVVSNFEDHDCGELPSKY
jgi:hypothetical protein